MQMHHCTTGQSKKLLTKISPSSTSTSQKLQSSNNINDCNSSNGGVIGIGDGPLDALPKQFVISMKTLFDILDDQNTGYVKLIDIETGWQDDGSKGLPHGVIDSLRKVTPSNGMLTFERFCAGLKICLLRNQTITNNNHYQQHHNNHNQSLIQQQQQQPKIHLKTTTSEKLRRLSSDNIINNNNCNIDNNEFNKININQPIRPPSAPLLDIDNTIISINQWNNNNNTATVRPNNVCILNGKQQQQQKQRTLSLPQLSPNSDLELIESESIIQQHHNHHRHLHNNNNNHLPISKKIDLYGLTTIPIIPTTKLLTTPPPPPKPPRSCIYQNGLSTVNLNTGLDKNEIRNALQNWQMGVLMNEMDIKENKIKNNNDNNYNNYISQSIRGKADGGSIELQSNNNNNNNNNIIYPISSLIKKQNIKRREPRRHTLQNGIDYNLLKRLKQFESERDILIKGLQAVDNAKEWYLQQLSNVQDKMNYLGRMGSHVVQWSEVHQERLDFKRARILEINRHLSTLSDIPVHMNLAVRPLQNISRVNNCIGANGGTNINKLQSISQQQQQRHIIDDNTNGTIIKNISDRITIFDCDNQKRSNRNNQIGIVKLPSSSSSNIVHTDVTF